MSRRSDPADIIAGAVRFSPAPRRGLSHDEAAAYVGIGTTKFDEMVADGRMPQPVRIDGRVVWDLRRLDLAFDALSDGIAVDPYSEVR